MSEFKVVEMDATLVEISTETPWRFKRKDGSFVDAQLKQESVVTHEKGAFKVTAYGYKTDDDSIQAKRCYVEAGEHAGFIIDKIATQEDLCVYADFSLKNEDGNSWCNIADKHKLVERNAVAGMKHFRLFSLMDGNDIMAKAGLLMPAKIGADQSINYAMYEGLYNFGQQHLIGHGYCSNEPASVAKWHFTATENVHCVEPSNHEEGWLMELQGDILKVTDKLNPERSIAVNISNSELV